MGLRTKLATAVLVLLAATIIAITIASIDRTLAVMVENLSDSAERISAEIFEQMRAVMATRPADAPRAIAQDQALATLLESSRAFGKGVVYARIEDAHGNVIAGNPDERQAGSQLPGLDDLERHVQSHVPLSLIGPLWRDHTYEFSRPVEANGEVFATIRIGMSTGLLAHEVHQLVGQDVAITFLALLLSAGAVLLLGELFLRPVIAITTGVEQLTSGVPDVTLTVAARDELGTLADKFNQLSQRVRADRSRWESERGHLFDVFRSISDVVLLLDADRSLLFANNEAETRLGLPTAGKGEAKPLNALLGPDHPLVRMVDAAFNAGSRIRDSILELAPVNGSPPVRFLVSIFTLGKGPETPGALVMMRDLEPVRELESVMDYSSQLARLGGLISGVAHQIRNPLNAMTLQLELLRQDAEAGNNIATRITRVRHEIRRLDQAVDALLRFMRPEKLRIEDVSLNDLLSQVGDRVLNPGIGVEYELDPSLPQIKADGAVLTEAFENLVRNAVEAMPTGGQIKIGSRAAGSGFVEASVCDHGVGINPQDLDRIFNLYFTTKESGSGIGLSLALRAVELHHGTIKIDSTPGGGTTVMIKLPAKAAIEVRPESRVN